MNTASEENVRLTYVVYIVPAYDRNKHTLSRDSAEVYVHIKKLKRIL